MPNPGLEGLLGKQFMVAARVSDITPGGRVPHMVFWRSLIKRQLPGLSYE